PAHLFLNIICRDVLALPAEGIAESVGKTHPVISVEREEVSGVEVPRPVAEGIVEDLRGVLRFIDVAFEFGHAADLREEDSAFPRLGRDELPVFLDHLLGVGIDLREDMSALGRNPPDHPDLPSEVDEPDVALRRAVVFEDLRDREALAEFGPDLGAEARAEDHADAMLSLEGMRLRPHEIPADLSDIRDHRHVEAIAIIEEAARREFSPEGDGASTGEHDAPRLTDACIVIERK